MTPDGTSLEGDLSLPDGMAAAEAKVKGTATSTSFELKNESILELNLGGFTALGHITVRPAGMIFAGDVFVPNMGAISVGMKGPIGSSGSLALHGGGNVLLHSGCRAKGTFTLTGSGKGGTLSLAGGEFAFTNLVKVAVSTLSIAPDGVVSCSGVAVWGTRPFPVDFSIDVGATVMLAAAQQFPSVP